MMRKRTLRAVTALVLVLATLSVSAAYAEPFGNDAFRQVWERTDYPVQQGAAQHSWIWGPEPFTLVLREYFPAEQGPNTREVQYIDKGRMEINDPAADPRSPWYVTSGLLSRELIEGRVQVGYDSFIPLTPATIPVAGDPDNRFPSYADLGRVYEAPMGSRVGDSVTRQLLPDSTGRFSQYSNDPATRIAHIERGFGIPQAFWQFMNQGGTIFRNGTFVRSEPLVEWLYVVGYPVTDAYWTRVRVGGVERDVLFQIFERRVLTYSPANSPQFQVEMGNIGQHYYAWRYEQPFRNNTQAVITFPPADSLVSSPLTVQGFESGAAFEASVLVRLRTNDGTVLAEQNTLVQRPDIAVPGPFAVTLNYTPPAQTTGGVVEVVVSSPRDGARRVIAAQPVMIAGGTGGAPGNTIITPAAGAQVTLPLHIQARVGEAGQTVIAELRLANGVVFTGRFELLAAPGGGGLLIDSLDWTGEGPPPAYTSQTATLRLRTPEGNELAAQEVQILSPDSNQVDRVDLYWLIGEEYVVEERVIPATENIAAAALEELLWGPAPRNQAGFTTAIPTPEQVLNSPVRETDWGPRVRLLGLTIENGIATADFSQELRAYGGGSARVQAIREQITRTLLRFANVSEVRIAIEGEVEGVLEP